MLTSIKFIGAALLLSAGLWCAVDMITGFNPYRNAVMFFAAMTCILSSAALIGLFKE